MKTSVNLSHTRKPRNVKRDTVSFLSDLGFTPEQRAEMLQELRKRMNEIDQRKLDQTTAASEAWHVKIERGIADAQRRRDELAVRMDSYKKLETSEDYAAFAALNAEWQDTINEIEIWQIQRKMFAKH